MLCKIDTQRHAVIHIVAGSNVPYKGVEEEEGEELGTAPWLRISPSALTAIRTSASCSSMIPVARDTGRSSTTVVVSIVDMGVSGHGRYLGLEIWLLGGR
jgi:hypothetical protein